jgi:DHA1 family bicyclomycin/chloramphenicol resistance-like MFS transporter
MIGRMLNTATPPHILTLVMAASVGALAMNVFLPSLPSIARYYDADYRVVQLAVSLYLAATALLQLFIGPASDRFGRRPVMLACFAIFLIGTLATIYAPTIELFLAARFMQAFSAAGIVLSRAIARDTVGPDEAASMIGYITMGMALTPMVAPMIGGILDQLYGWQSTFLLILGFGLVSFVIVFFDLGETNAHRSSSMLAQTKAYPELFLSRRFWGYSLTAAFASGSFFAFLGGGPFVASEILGLRPAEYGFYFGILSAGYMIGNFISGRYAQRIGVNRMMLAGGLVSSIALVGAMVLYQLGYLHPIAFFGPVALTGIGNGMTLPSANAGVVSVRPHLAGSASGLGGALQIGGGAALAALAGALLTETSGAMPLLWVMVVSAVLAVVTTLYVIYVAHKAGEV